MPRGSSRIGCEISRRSRVGYCFYLCIVMATESFSAFLLPDLVLDIAVSIGIIPPGSVCVERLR